MRINDYKDYLQNTYILLKKFKNPVQAKRFKRLYECFKQSNFIYVYDCIIYNNLNYYNYTRTALIIKDFIELLKAFSKESDINQNIINSLDYELLDIYFRHFKKHRNLDYNMLQPYKFIMYVYNRLDNSQIEKLKHNIILYKTIIKIEMQIKRQNQAKKVANQLFNNSFLRDCKKVYPDITRYEIVKIFYKFAFLILENINSDDVNEFLISCEY